MIRAAGILYRARSDGSVLFLQRSGVSDHAGEWCFPGGKLEDGETPEQAAVRESKEEIGSAPDGERKLLARRVGPVGPAPVDVPGDAPDTLAVRDDEVDFTTFLQEIDEPFEVTLDEEHTGHAWAPADKPPEPLHPGARVALAKLSANELDVARMMAAGDLTSPQFYANMMLLDLRITGTGVAYRKAHDEYCYRAPENYLTPEFLQRCNGLPVLWEHPAKATLDSKEWADRVVGTTFLPYIKGDEVWAVVKIYDDYAIGELTNGEPWSTSPTVDFGAGVVLKDVNTKGTLTLEDGREVKLLVEGEPPLVDHLAICGKGVWDKGGEPSGVNTARADEDMADEDDKKQDAAKADAENDRFNKLMDSVGKISDSVGSLAKRMDSYEEERKSDKKKDADEETKKANEAADEPGAGDDKKVEAKKSDAAKKDVDEDEMAKSDKKADESEDKDKKDDKKADARADSDVVLPRADYDRLVRQVTDLSTRFDATNLSDADHAALSGAQARADAIYQAFGKQAPRPLAGETDIRYRRRVANDLKQHSRDWKDTDMTALPDSSTFKAIETRIYADALEASRDPIGIAEGELREVRVRDALGGRERIEFHGKPGSWMDDFKQKPMKARFIRPHHAH